MSTYYVDPSATGNNDGGGDGGDPSDPTQAANWTDAWTTLQSATDTAVGGDIVYCRGTETLTAPIDLDASAGTTAGGWIKYIGCNSSTGAVDGSRYTLDGNSTAVNCLLFYASPYGVYLWFENMVFTGATGSGVAFPANVGSPTMYVNCVAHTNGSFGFDNSYTTSGGLDLGPMFIRCQAYSNTGSGFSGNSRNIFYYFCVAHDNGGDGLDFAGLADNYSVAFGCLIYNNGAYGTGYAHGKTFILNCIYDENEDDGVLAQGEHTMILGCRFTDNGKGGTGYGINGDGSGRVVYGWNFFLDNADGPINGYADTIRYDATANTNETSGTEGYVDGAGRDYNLTANATLRSTAIEMD